MTQTPERHSGERHPEDGFTLVEMMAVMSIIATLGTIVFLTVRPGIDQASITKARADVGRLEQAVEMYRLTLGQYPNQLQDLVQPPNDAQLASRYPRGGFVEVLPQDPWNNAYLYQFPGERGEFDIVSFGSDGEPGGEGTAADIASWQQ